MHDCIHDMQALWTTNSQTLSSSDNYMEPGSFDYAKTDRKKNCKDQALIFAITVILLIVVGIFIAGITLLSVYIHYLIGVITAAVSIGLSLAYCCILCCND